MSLKCNLSINTNFTVLTIADIDILHISIIIIKLGDIIVHLLTPMCNFTNFTNLNVHEIRLLIHKLP